MSLLVAAAEIDISAVKVYALLNGKAQIAKIAANYQLGEFKAIAEAA